LWKDPIVEETRARREQYAAALHHDMDAIFLDIRIRQANRAQKPVSLPARKPNRDSDAA
jgi:hypothetical protein